METIDLIGSKVLPDVLERDAASAPEREERKAAIIEKVAALEPSHPTVDPEYVFTAPAKAWGTDEETVEVLEALKGLGG